MSTHLDYSAQMNTLRSVVTTLGDPNTKDDIKLKAAQELSEHFEVITQCPGYQTFLEHSMKIFIKILKDGDPHFITESHIQQVRKLILEMIHRLPTSEILRPYVKHILTLMLTLLKIDNEENVLVCLRIIIELHKQYRPEFNPEIQDFLSFVKAIYSDLPKHLTKIFEPRAPIRVKDLSELNISELLNETYTTTPIQADKKTADGAVVTYNLIPKGVLSLKVLQELPIIVVLMYQIYKQYVHLQVAEFVPLIMTTITLQPLPVHRNSPSFNKEVFVDFMGAQIKTLSFLAYIIRLFQDVIVNHATSMVKGMLSLLQSCPKEVAHLRKELLIAARHILATDLRNKFVPSMDKLFDEDLLLGRGYTTHESLRPLAYSTLADLVHHVRQHLNMVVLAKAVHLFSKNVHDESLPTSIQTMSCKLLLNLVDCIRQRSDSETTTARDLLIIMLKVFTKKFHTIAKLQLPLIMQKWKTLKPETPSTPTGSAPTSITTVATVSAGTENAREMLDITASEQASKLSSIGFPPPNNLNVSDYRSLVKTLVCGVKTITWGCASCKSPASEANYNGALSKMFQPPEILIFIDLVHWALEALDIYTINIPANGIAGGQMTKPSGQLPRSKEEKEVLEHFSGVFLLMNNQNFQEIFASTIDYMVERIYKNSALQIIANSFLANPATSPLFATVLVEYLLERMEEMGSNIDRSNLYLRLFKLVFGSVSLFPAENEQMLRPHLHNIVNRSMELAMTAKEPYNYFLLLRALFRSIGGGSHDLLYQEFLPLLPNLLEGLNRLQSGFHKQHMKDLFVELCLTVPVRLSSLLPYLPMLMDPLVSALNGSHTLISQGLRTLELCVDNLQPDFLYDHIQPVRADLMQALWRTLRNQDSAAQVAFRVLGKFGGGNRKMMIEPQRLEYHDKDTPAPAIVAYFQDHQKPIDFPIDKVIETAFNALKSSTTDPFYWRQSWDVIRCYLASSICVDDQKHTLQKLFMHPSFLEGPIHIMPGRQYKCQDLQARKTHQTALTAMFVAAATKDVRQSVLPTMVAVVRHYTMVAIAQQAGPFHLKYRMSNGLDPLVLIDALAVIMGHEEKELCKPGHLAMVLILQTATHIMGTKERACRLPMMQYLAERMAGLCYERPWYAKMGGCTALKFLYQHMAMRWLYQHLFEFLKAFMFVIMDLAGEVSSGAIDMAKTYLEKMLRTCMVPLDKDCKNEELIATQNKAMADVVRELVRQVTSSNTLVREQAMSSLKLIAELQNKTVTDVMDPHRKVLADIIPPKKHVLCQQPASAQIGLMDGNTFCTTLNPRLFTIDLSNQYHNYFFKEVSNLCEAEDQYLNKLDCYKNVTNLVPLRTSALRALAACHYITDVDPDGSTRRDKILAILLRALEKNNTEIQETAFECLKKFIVGYQVDKETIHNAMRPLLLTLGDYRNLTLNGTKRLSYLTQLFPSMFNEKLCEQLLQHIRKMLEHSIAANKGQNFLTLAKTGDTEQKITTIMGIFHQIPAASAKFIESLCRMILQMEKSLMIEPSCPFREPLIKFLLRYPKETLELFLNDNNIKDQQLNRFMIYLLKHKDGGPFRTIMQTKSARLIQLIYCNPADGVATLQSQQVILVSLEDRYEAQHQAMMIIQTLIEFNDQWLASESEIVNALKQIWETDLYKSCEANVSCDLWHLVAKILLHYFSHHTNDINLLFLLLKALCMRFIPDFQFLRDFLQNTVAQSYTCEWKRKAFFQFVDDFNNANMSQELKAKILTSVLIPSFAVSFEKGEGNKLVGAPPAPYLEDDNNVVSVFIGKVIDPEKPFANADAVRIALLQFACLLVERAAPHIHDGDANNKRQGNKLRRLMTFAWPCLLLKNCVDPAARYHGHLLLSHIIARLAIHKRIVIQVFYSLLKGHAIEARSVVRQALEVLTPALPLRMEDGNTMLTHWTKKIIVEEGHSMQQLFHILQLVVRHYKVYYPVRHHLVQHMINSIQRLGFSATATMDYRKLAVELAEVIIKWELQRIKDETDPIDESDSNIEMKYSATGAVTRTAPDDNDNRKKLSTDSNEPIAGPSTAVVKVEGAGKPIEKVHCDTVLNFLMRLACQVNEATTTVGTISPGESLSRRCVTLVKMAMKPEVWPQACDLKLSWMDKLFASVHSQQQNFGNICTALELLTFLLGVMKKDQILATFKPMKTGLSACVTCTNTRVTKLMHGLLSRLMAIFPTDSHHKQEELETLYATVSKMIFEGLAAYDKDPQANPSSLFGTLMILKAACMNNPSYIDRIIMPFMRLLHRLTNKEHLQGTTATTPQADGTNTSTVAIELLLLSLELVKNRVVVMGVEMRKLFIGNILVGLIEKSPDVKVMKAIVKIIEDWMKNENNPVTVTQAPTLREKSILLVKLMQYVEKRFPDDLELNAQFLELINYIYRDEQLKQSELTSKLEAAFLAGLRCNQPHIRAKFFEIFDGSMRRRLHDRFLYVICSQAWDSIGQHYWIKQCIELLILTANTTTPIQNSNENHLLPSISSVINLADSEEKNNFVIYTSKLQNESTDSLDSIEDKEDAFDMDMSVDSNISRREESERPVSNRPATLTKLIARQAEFLESVRKVRSEQLLVATSQLCHMDTQLAEKVWLDIFPRLWSILDEGQQQSLVREIIPFLASGTHVIQKDCHPSALNTFVEALSHCNPPVYLPPNLMTYLGKAHNLWHRMTLMLETMALDWPQKKDSQSEYSDPDAGDYSPNDADQSSVFDPLSQMYSALHEEDLWAGLWLKYAKYTETNNAIAYEQMGFFEEAQGAYDLVMTKFKQETANGPAPLELNSELVLWEKHWIRCATELNQWDILLDYAQSSKEKNSFLTMESAWRVPDWALMKQALLKVEQACPKQEGYKVNLYRGFLAILNKDEPHLSAVERYVEVASVLCMREWRRLPPIVSHIHLPILQAAQQIMELQEACQIHQGLTQSRTSIHDMKAIVKTWRNRLPVVADDLSHWSDIFTWRQHHYQIITSYLEEQKTDIIKTNLMMGAHASEVEGAGKPIEKVHCDTVLNFLMRLACQVNEATTTVGTISPGESLSRRCVTLVKMAMKPEVWPQACDLKLSWMDKLFASVHSQQQNFGNICTALELLTFLLGVMKKDQILATFKPMKTGLSACVTCTNTRVTKLMHGLLSRLMAIFPTDSHHKQEELETLYATVSKMIFEGLAAYDKDPQANPSSLFGTLMILKAACMNNPSYIDRIIMPFMRLLHRLTNKEHLQGTTATTPQADGTNTSTVAIELLLLSLELVKNRVVVMGVEMRKLFIGNILVGLIEKSPDVKVMKAIVKIIEDWMKNENNPVTVTQAPTLREKSILLVKLMQYVEKRFPDDLELNAQFLELINYIYRDEQLKQSELTSKLEAAFLAGLRCNQPHIRAKFFEIFDGSMRRRLHDRFLYVICSQAWDSIGQHYWIKQCIELLILTANTTTPIQNSNENHLLPSISSVINLADSEEKNNFVIYTSKLQNESTDSLDSIEDKEDAFDMDMSVDSNISRREESERPVSNRPATLTKLIARQAEFLESVRKVRSEQLLVATSQLCHMDTQLAEKVWLDIFPRLWSILDEGQQQSLVREIIPFLASGTHVIQKDCHPSALNTFVEALSHCNPPVYLPPNLMTYLGKAHNLWHRMTLMLETMALDWPQKKDSQSEYSDPDAGDYSPNDADQSSVFDPLSQMYSALHEEDLWAGLWLKYAKYTETNNAIAYEQMGFFEEAQGAYDLVMTKFKQETANGPAPLELNSELVLWEKHWIRCATELNQWDILLDYAQSSKEKNSFLTMESAWRVPDWALMKQALLKVEQACPKQEGYKVNLYRGFLAILNKDEPHLSAVERYVEVASVLCMREWRRLPPIVSHIHLPILQAAQQIMELQEACQIHQGLTQSRTSIHDMKAIVKTWRNRLPVVADDLSHWSDIFTWRQHHYQIITSYLEEQKTDIIKTNLMMGAHASAQAIIHFGKMARKHNLTGVCQDSLSRIYTIPSVPIVDCFQKIRQQIKCFLQKASTSSGRVELAQALEVIESTNLSYFENPMIAEFMALKGLLFAQSGNSEEANKAFSAAVQVHDTLIKAWALWGDYLEHIFTRESRQMNLGVSAIVCFLHACRHQNESKSRKYLAKVLWLLCYDDDKSSLMEALDKYAVGVPPLHWLPWIPQLLCCLVQYESRVILNLLSQVGRMFPQAVYFPIRTLYLTLKIEQREKHKSAEQASLANKLQSASNQGSGDNVLVNAQPPPSPIVISTTPATRTPSGQPTQASSIASAGPIKATQAMWRCSKVMHVQREIHPTILNSLEGIVDQMVWFRENWREEVLRQLRQGLIKCYAIAFENRSSVNDATITPHTLNFVRKLVSTFGIGVENISPAAQTYGSAASESLARQAQATVSDPAFQKMKGQFTSDFDFSQPGAMKLHNLIGELTKWIIILESNTKQMSKSFLIEEKCRFLSNFSQKTAEVELPGELLLPRPSHYHIRIARFMPRVTIVQKHNTAARRLYIRGTNGKIYPYLVVNDSGLGDARREERVLQLLRMLNHYLAKQKETSRRFLHITVPRVVAVSPQMRLVEDNPSSISLLDIFKNGCNKLSIDHHDLPIKRYYERLADVQARGSQTTHNVLRDILREIQSSMVPKTLLKDWATRNFRSATDYWQFRKMFTLQLSLACLCEHALHLTRLNADMMYLHQDSGLVNISYFKFDVDDATGELDANRPVPFRLTPNIVEYLSTIGITGPLTASAIATARCLVQPNFKLSTILRAILRDEIFSIHKKRLKDEKPILDANGEIATEPEVDMEKIISLVNKAVDAIMQRLNNISYFDNVESNKMSTLVQAAHNPDNLCRMDPAWHPWV